MAEYESNPATELQTADAPDQIADESCAPTAFGRIRWWFEESPMAFVTALAMFMILFGVYWILGINLKKKYENSATGVALQEVLVDSAMDSGTQSDGEDSYEIDIPEGLADREEMADIEVPDLPIPETEINFDKLRGSEDNNEEQLEIERQLSKAGEMLRKRLQANQSGTGTEPGNGSDREFGTLNPNSTAGRQARWVITYPTVPQAEYESMLDFFKIELAYLMRDENTLQYLGDVSGAGSQRKGNVTNETRMFWVWEGQNRLRQLDEAILRKHGLEPPREVVHLYPKKMEEELAEKEKRFLAQKHRTNQVERILETDFRISSDGGGAWRMEVTNIRIR